MIPIATTTREPIERAIFGGTASNINTVTIYTITIATITITDKARNLRLINTVIGTTTIITFTILTIYATTTTTSVIDKITSDTRARVSEFKIRWIRAWADGAIILSITIIPQTIIQIRILMTNNTPLHGSKLAEWVGFNKYDDNFFSLSLITGKIKI